MLLDNIHIYIYVYKAFFGPFIPHNASKSKGTKPKLNELSHRIFLLLAVFHNETNIRALFFNMQESSDSRSHHRRVHRNRNLNGQNVLTILVSILLVRFYSLTEGRVVQIVSSRIWRCAKNYYMSLAQIINNYHNNCVTNNEDNRNTRMLSSSDNNKANNARNNLINVDELLNGIPYNY